MMYSEFMDSVPWDESYITYDDYVTYLEPIYMKYEEEYDGGKDMFYRTYELYTHEVYKPLELIIMGKSVYDTELYLNGDENIWADVDKAHDLLKRGFLKKFQYHGMDMLLFG